MIIDFRKTKTEIPELQAEQSPISRVSSYKLLVVWIDNNLKWETNTWALIKKGRKRLYFLKILKNYGALTKDLLAFYVVFNKREVVFYQSTKGRGRSPRPFVL
jgi:hypothetical protein